MKSSNLILISIPPINKKDLVLKLFEKEIKNSDFKWLSPAITVTVLVCGLGTNWGMTKTSLDTIKNQVAKIELKVEQHEDKIRDIQIQQAGNIEILKNQEDEIDTVGGMVYAKINRIPKNNEIIDNLDQFRKKA